MNRPEEEAGSKIVCPRCLAILNVSRDAAGKRLKCPKCGLKLEPPEKSNRN